MFCRTSCRTLSRNTMKRIATFRPPTAIALIQLDCNMLMTCLMIGVSSFIWLSVSISTSWASHRNMTNVAIHADAIIALASFAAAPDTYSELYIIPTAKTMVSKKRFINVMSALFFVWSSPSVLIFAMVLEKRTQKPAQNTLPLKTMKAPAHCVKMTVVATPQAFVTRSWRASLSMPLIRPSSRQYSNSGSGDDTGGSSSGVNWR
mmetsp:Transcript_25655/g.73245  ORF Transcript_25655/g.73245 Transcript_25655/m.73245 type:complete len:205 (+) Transcript_25655:1351-1965(+)